MYEHIPPRRQALYLTQRSKAGKLQLSYFRIAFLLWFILFVCIRQTLLAKMPPHLFNVDINHMIDRSDLLIFDTYRFKKP